MFDVLLGIPCSTNIKKMVERKMPTILLTGKGVDYALRSVCLQSKIFLMVCICALAAAIAELCGVPFKMVSLAFASICTVVCIVLSVCDQRASYVKPNRHEMNMVIISLLLSIAEYVAMLRMLVSASPMIQTLSFVSATVFVTLMYLIQIIYFKNYIVENQKVLVLDERNERRKDHFIIRTTDGNCYDFVSSPYYPIFDRDDDCIYLVSLYKHSAVSLNKSMVDEVIFNGKDITLDIL